MDVRRDTGSVISLRLGSQSANSSLLGRLNGGGVGIGGSLSFNVVLSFLDWDLAGRFGSRSDRYSRRITSRSATLGFRLPSTF